MAEKHSKKFSIVRKMLIETTLRLHLTPVRMAKIKYTSDNYAGEDVEPEEHL